MMAVTFLSSIVTLAVWIPAAHSVGGIVSFVALFGFSSGGFVSLMPTLIASISDIRQIGTRTGIAMAVMSFGALTGSPIAGGIVESMDGQYLGLQLFCGFCMLTSVVFYGLARGFLGNWKLAAKI